MKKRILSLLTVICMMSSLIVAFPAVNAEEIEAMGSLSETSIKWYLYDNGLLELKGTGGMPDIKDASKLPWHAYRSNIKTVKISDGITNIANHSFVDCTNLTDIEIPTSVTSIGTHAFKSCKSLTSAILHEGITDIGYQAYNTCTGLKIISIPSTLETIGTHAFYDTTSLEKIIWNARNVSGFSLENYIFTRSGTKSNGIEIIFGDTVDTIPISFLNPKNGGSGYTPNVTAIDLGNNVSVIDEYSLLASSITDIIIPENVTAIKQYTFKTCTSLEKAIILGNVETIGYQAFFCDSNLKEVYLPASLKNVDSHAFHYCTALTDVYFGGTEEEWKSITIADYNTYLTDATIHYNSVPEVPVYNTVSFVDENGTTYYAEILSEDEIVTEPDAPVKEGYEFVGWDQDLTNITEDTVVKALYEPIVTTYTVQFVDNDGTVLDTQEVEEGMAAYDPEVPEKDGYKFTGWDTDFSYVTENLTVTAQYVRVYTVKFVGFSGEDLGEQTVEEGMTAEAPEAPVIDGYTFTGWDTDFSKVTNDLIVTAQYEEIPVVVTTYTVQFVDFDGKVIDTQEVEEGMAAIEPEVPAKEGYTFIGWDTDFSKVTENLTVTAQYEKNVEPDPEPIYYTVTFDSNNGICDVTEITVENGSTYGTLPVPQKEGFSFAGWYTALRGGEKITEDTTVNLTENQTLYARWIDESALKNITVSSSIAKNNDTVTVTISADENIGMAIGSILLNYDLDVLTYNEAIFGDILCNSSNIVNENYKGTNKIYASFAGTDNIFAGGTLLTLTFTVNEITEKELLSLISIDEVTLYDNTEEPIAVNVIDGDIHIINYAKGDVNKNDDVEILDVLRVMQYDVGLREFDDVEMYLADVNSDNWVNIIDALLIQKYDAGLIQEF